EALYQLAFLVELHDRIELRVRARTGVLATVKRPDALAIAIDIKADDRAPFASIRKLGPAIGELVGIGRFVGTIHQTSLGMATVTRHRQHSNEGDTERQAHAAPHDSPPIDLLSP